MKQSKIFMVLAVSCLIVLPIAIISSGVFAGAVAFLLMMLFAYLATCCKTKAPVKEGKQDLLQRVKMKEHRFEEELQSIPVEPIAPAVKVSRQLLLDMPEITFSRIPKDPERLFPLVVLDTETTGLRPTKDDIVEVSAIKFEDWFSPVSCFTTLCRPLRGINEEAASINHITEEMVEGKPLFQEVAPQLSEFISGCNIAGYNVLFDIKFLFVGGTEFNFERRFYDVLKIARDSIPKDEITDYQLETVSEYLGIFRADAHRSLSDSLVTAKVLEELCSR